MEELSTASAEEVQKRKDEERVQKMRNVISTQLRHPVGPFVSVPQARSSTSPLSHLVFVCMRGGCCYVYADAAAISIYHHYFIYYPVVSPLLLKSRSFTAFLAQFFLSNIAKNLYKIPKGMCSAHDSLSVEFVLQKIDTFRYNAVSVWLGLTRLGVGRR